MAYIERVLVTGAQGRIGRDLVPRLEQSQFQVYRLDRVVSVARTDLVQCDLNDPQGLRQAFRGMHAIVHLAGQSWECDFHRELLPDNLAGCFNVFEAACAAGVRRVIFASTSHVLGDALNENHSLRETETPRPDTLYAVSKLFGENLARYYADSRGLSVICARIGWYLRDDDERLLTDPHAQALFVSARDLEQFVLRSLSVRNVHFEVLNCTSANLPARVPLERAREVLGFQPRDGVKRRPRSTPPDTLDAPLIIVGSIRAGTTVLAQCIASHPDFRYLPFELMREWRELAGIEISTSANDDEGCPPYPKDHLSPEQMAKARRGFADMATKAGVLPGTRWVTKNPHLWNKLPLVTALFPKATIVVASRGIRSTVSSLKHLWQAAHERHGTRYHLPEDPRECWRIGQGEIGGVDPSRVYPEGGILLLADYWLRTYEEIERVSPDVGSLVRVLHKDLVADSRAALSPVCEAAGVGDPDTRHDLESRESLARARLTESEHDVLDQFIRKNQGRIECLKWADTTP